MIYKIRSSLQHYCGFLLGGVVRTEEAWRGGVARRRGKEAWRGGVASRSDGE